MAQLNYMNMDGLEPNVNYSSIPHFSEKANLCSYFGILEEGDPELEKHNSALKKIVSLFN